MDPCSSTDLRLAEACPYYQEYLQGCLEIIQRTPKGDNIRDTYLMQLQTCRVNESLRIFIQDGSSEDGSTTVEETSHEESLQNTVENAVEDSINSSVDMESIGAVAGGYALENDPTV